MTLGLQIHGLLHSVSMCESCYPVHPIRNLELWEDLARISAYFDNSETVSGLVSALRDGDPTQMGKTLQLCSFPPPLTDLSGKQAHREVD